MILNKLGGVKQGPAQNVQINLVLDYVLESERQDFEEYPSKHHVYFHAYAVRYGYVRAECMLSQTVENENDLL